MKRLYIVQVQGLSLGSLRNEAILKFGPLRKTLPISRHGPMLLRYLRHYLKSLGSAGQATVVLVNNGDATRIGDGPALQMYARYRNTLLTDCDAVVDVPGVADTLAGRLLWKRTLPSGIFADGPASFSVGASNVCLHPLNSCAGGASTTALLGRGEYLASGLEAIAGAIAKFNRSAGAARTFHVVVTFHSPNGLRSRDGRWGLLRPSRQARDRLLTFCPRHNITWLLTGSSFSGDRLSVSRREPLWPRESPALLMAASLGCDVKLHTLTEGSGGELQWSIRRMSLRDDDQLQAAKDYFVDAEVIL